MGQRKSPLQRARIPSKPSADAVPPKLTTRSEPLKIGHLLRERRRSLNLTLAATAEAVGVTKGFLSDVENDKAAPSVTSLVRVCDVLGLAVGSLFKEQRSRIVRAADRTQIRFGGEHLLDYLLTPSGISGLMVVWSEIEPGGGGGKEFYSLPSEDSFALVFSGNVEFAFANEKFVLGAGDAMTWKSQTPHTFRNSSRRDPAVVLFVMAPAPR